MPNQIKWLLWVVSSVALVRAPQAASYFVAANGDDQRSASLARDPSTPWKTFVNVDSLKLAPGDSILVKRGDTIRGRLHVTVSGTQAKPIVVSGFGEGTNPPVILGTRPAGGWVAVGSDVWKAKWTTTDTVSTLYRNGAAVPIARFPKGDDWGVATKVEADSALTSPHLAGVDWRGATVFVRISPWSLEARTIVRQTGGRIAFKKLQSKMRDSIQFFINGHIASLGEPGTWALSPADSMVFWKGNPGESPDGLEISGGDDGVSLGGENWIKVEGLNIVASAGNGVSGTGVGVTVENCLIREPGGFGVLLTGGRGLVQNNQINGAVAGGVLAFGPGYQIINNQIVGVAKLSALTTQGIPKACGIRLEGDSGRVARNRLDSIGYSGITFIGRASVIEENLVEHFCMSTSDGGGIYTWAGGYDSTGSEGSVVRRNVVRNGLSASDGWNWRLGGTNAAEGIYFDDGVHDVRVDSNLSMQNRIGLLYHNCRRINGHGNIMVGSSYTEFALSHDNNAGAGDMYGNTLDSSILLSYSDQGRDTLNMLRRAQSVEMGSVSGNLDCIDRKASLECNEDGHRVLLVDRMEGKANLAGPERLQNKGFDSSALGWIKWPPQVGLTKFASNDAPANNFVKVSFAGVQPSVFPYVSSQKPSKYEAGHWYWLTFKAKGQRLSQGVDLVLLRSYGDYAKLLPPVRVNFDTTWSDYSLFIQPAISDTQSQLHFVATSTDSVFWLDDVSFREVPDSVTKSTSGAVVQTNPSNNPIEVQLGEGSWVDSRGLDVPSSLTLQPYDSRVFFRKRGFIPQIQVSVLPRRQLSVNQVGNALRLDGLDSKAVLIDQRGRVLATLVPDAQGVAYWQHGSFRGIAYVKTLHKSSKLIVLH